MSEDLHFGTIAGIAPLIRDRRLSPVELTRSVLACIDRLDGRLHSYASAMAEQALQARSAPRWRSPPAAGAGHCTESRLQ